MGKENGGCIGGCLGNIVKLVAVLLLIVGIGVIGVAMRRGDRNTGPVSEPQPVREQSPAPVANAAPVRKPIELGDEVVLGFKGRGIVVLAVDDKSWDELIAAQNADDLVGIRKLAEAGRAVLVPGGSRAKVIDTGFTSFRVRILDGEAAEEAGWIQRELVRHAPETAAPDSSDDPAQTNASTKPLTDSEKNAKQASEKQKARSKAAAERRRKAGL